MAAKDDAKVRTVDTGAELLIPVSESVSTRYDASATTVLGFFLPDNWTDCQLSFEVARESDEVGAQAALYSLTAEGSPYQIPTTASTYIAVPAYIFAGCRQVKLVCNTPQLETVHVKVAGGPLFS